jgi:hypothetical protein
MGQATRWPPLAAGSGRQRVRTGCLRTGCLKDARLSEFADAGPAEQLGVALSSLEAFVAFSHPTQSPALLASRPRNATRCDLEATQGVGVEIGQQAVVLGERFEGLESLSHIR